MTSWQIFYKSFVTNDGYKDVLLGLKNTMIIALIGLAIGIIIGTLIAIVKVVPKNNIILKLLDKLGSFYVSLFRGTPIVVQLLIAYYVLFPLVGLRIDKLIVAVIAFGMNSGAYVSEIMRGGILSVDSGQLEAARSLGLGYARSMWQVVLPQSLKNILPTIGNELIALVKETSVVSFIAVVDLTRAFKSIGDSTYEYLVPYIMLALSYLVIVILFTYIIKFVERRMRKSDRRN